MIREVINSQGARVDFENFVLCVGKGWHSILYKLYDDLVKLGWDLQLSQVKEKFGTLRFYIGYGSDEMFSVIDKTEHKTSTTCEECGRPGRINNDNKYWIRTLCDECR